MHLPRLLSRGPDRARTSQPSSCLWCRLSCCPQLLELLHLRPQSSVAFSPGPPPSQLTPGPAVKNPMSYSPTLGSIFLPPGPVTPARSAGSTSLLPPPGLPSGHQVPKTPASAASSPVPSSASSQAAVTPSQAVTSKPQTLPDVQALMQIWQDVIIRSMQDRMMNMLGVAPPQPTAGPSIPTRNMGPQRAAAGESLW